MVEEAKGVSVEEVEEHMQKGGLVPRLAPSLVCPLGLGSDGPHA